MRTASLIRSCMAVFAAAGASLCLTATAATNLITNGGFESGVWGGTDSFIDSNNASNLLFWNTQVANWVPDSNSTWIQDTTRASEGNRFVWLGPPGAPFNQAITYISQTVATNTLASGLDYHLSLDFDFLDPNDPNNMMGMTSTLKVYYLLGNDMDMGGGNIMLMDDINTQTDLLTESGITDSWNNPSGLQWNSDGIDFTMPNLAGYDYLRIFFAAPPNTVQTPSMGVLVDNLSLSVVPEPGSFVLLGAGLLGLMGRRRVAARAQV